MRGMMGVQQQSRSTVCINSSLLYEVKVDAAAAETEKRASWGDYLCVTFALKYKWQVRQTDKQTCTDGRRKRKELFIHQIVKGGRGGRARRTTTNTPTNERIKTLSARRAVCGTVVHTKISQQLLDGLTYVTQILTE